MVFTHSLESPHKESVAVSPYSIYVCENAKCSINGVLVKRWRGLTQRISRYCNVLFFQLQSKILNKSVPGLDFRVFRSEIVQLIYPLFQFKLGNSNFKSHLSKNNTEFANLF